MSLPPLVGVRKMKILLAVDDSRFSQAATRLSSKRAGPQRDELWVVHVVDMLSKRTPNMTAYYPGVERGMLDSYQPPPCEKCLKGCALKCFWS